MILVEKVTPLKHTQMFENIIEMCLKHFEGERIE